MVAGLKQELKSSLKQSSSATLKTLGKSGSGTSTKLSGKQNPPPVIVDQNRTLKIIQKALRVDERKKNQEEIKKVVR